VFSFNKDTMMNDNDKEQRIYDKLLYYFNKKVPVHINSANGYRNGVILRLDKSVVMIDDKIIKDDIFLSDIYEDSINRYVEEWR